MKNKHNTMNSSSSQKTYLSMQNQLIKEPNCSCYLVEAIAKKSQDIPWKVKVNGDILFNEKIRCVSLDRFYAEVTGDELAFYKMCQELSSFLDKYENSSTAKQNNNMEKILQEISNINPDIIKAIFKLSFPDYLGF